MNSIIYKIKILILISIFIIGSINGQQTGQHFPSKIKYETSIKYLPDSLASPFNHKSVNNNPNDPWADAEFQKNKNKLWRDSTLLFPLSDFDKIIGFKYKKEIDHRKRCLIDKDGYILEDLVLKGKVFTEKQAENLLAIINDTLTYYYIRFYNPVCSPVKEYEVLVIKDLNKIVGKLTVYQDRIELYPVIPRAWMLNKKKLNEIKDLVNECYNMRAVDYYRNIPDELIPVITSVIPSQKDIYTSDTVMFKLKLYKKSKLETYQKETYSTDSMYFRYFEEMAGISYQEGRLFKGVDSKVFLGFTYHNSNVNYGIYKTFFYEIEDGNYKKAELLPSIDYKDFIQNKEVLVQLEKNKMTKYLKINYQFLKEDNIIKAELSLSHGSVSEEISYYEENKEITQSENDFLELAELIKKADLKTEIIYTWDREKERFVAK